MRYNEGNNISKIRVECAMNRDGNWHSETARGTILFLRHQSPNAATALTQILNIFGAKAAYQASNAVMRLKADVEQMGETNTLDKYESALLEFQEALPLFRRALRWFLIDYGMGVKNRKQAKKLNPADSRSQDDLSIS
jgi:hypothetical protein